MGRWTLTLKVIGLSALTIVVIVGFLTTYFWNRQVHGMRIEQTRRIQAYGSLLAQQLRSAVAFGDRETAREVLGAVDPDVDAAVLFGDDGSELYSSGDPDPWVETAAPGVPHAQVVRSHGRIAVVVPIESREGPTGTLVVEMSTARSRARQRESTLVAVFLGLGLVMIGVFAAWWFSRGYVRRIDAMATVAEAVSRGDIGQTVAVEGAADELGQLGTAMNLMLQQLRTENLRLEERVGERTRELTDEMQRRARVELELRQAQKLESVGRLASGVAHEINTPLQFVNDSVMFVKDAMEEVLEGMAEGFDIAEHARECEAAAVLALDGIDRVVTIVKSLKAFAHPDRAEMSPADLNAAIASTLAIAKTEYKYVANVVTSFDELPPVVCHLGEINQVVLNLVVNAAHAIEDVVGDSGERGEIVIATRLLRGEVEIMVSDTGAGISDDIAAHVFEPFFTTKSVGRGTGQGLAIAHSVVVDKHGGTISFASEIGKGTTFRVRLPANVRPSGRISDALSGSRTVTPLSA